MAQEADHDWHEPVSGCGPAVLPVFEAAWVNAESSGCLLLQKSEIEPSLQDMVANVIERRGIARNRPRDSQ